MVKKKSITALTVCRAQKDDGLVCRWAESSSQLLVKVELLPEPVQALQVAMLQRADARLDVVVHKPLSKGNFCEAAAVSKSLRNAN